MGHIRLYNRNDFDGCAPHHRDLHESGGAFTSSSSPRPYRILSTPSLPNGVLSARRGSPFLALAVLVEVVSPSTTAALSENGCHRWIGPRTAISLLGYLPGPDLSRIGLPDGGYPTGDGDR